MSTTEQIAALQDELLELEIRLAAKRVELEMAQSAATEKPALRQAHRTEADRLRRLMERLIHSRRPECVARMEQERGLQSA